ncbi:MAG: hypothetical protein AAGI17_08615 [Planctomycetota bacterium]
MDRKRTGILSLAAAALITSTLASPAAAQTGWRKGATGVAGSRGEPGLGIGTATVSGAVSGGGPVFIGPFGGGGFHGGFVRVGFGGVWSHGRGFNNGWNTGWNGWWNGPVIFGGTGQPYSTYGPLNPQPPVNTQPAPMAPTGSDLTPGELDEIGEAGLRLALGQGSAAMDAARAAIDAGHEMEGQRMLGLALAIEGRFEDAAAVIRMALEHDGAVYNEPPPVHSADVAAARRLSRQARSHAQATGSASAWVMAIEIARATGTNFQAPVWLNYAEDAGLEGRLLDDLRFLLQN